MSSTTDHVGEPTTSPAYPTTPETSPTALTVDDWNVWREYFRSGRELNASLDRRLQDDAGISHPEFLVLLSLWRAPENQLRTGELALDLNWEKSRVSHQVTRMTKRGLVERRDCADDARGVWVALTDHGVKTLNSASLDHNDAITEWFFDVLTPDERQVFHDVSQRIRTRLRETGAVPEERPKTWVESTLLQDTALPTATDAEAPDAS